MTIKTVNVVADDSATLYPRISSKRAKFIAVLTPFVTVHGNDGVTRVMDAEAREVLKITGLAPKRVVKLDRFVVGFFAGFLFAATIAIITCRYVLPL